MKTLFNKAPQLEKNAFWTFTLNVCGDKWPHNHSKSEIIYIVETSQQFSKGKRHYLVCVCLLFPTTHTVTAPNTAHGKQSMQACKSQRKTLISKCIFHQFCICTFKFPLVLRVSAWSKAKTVAYFWTQARSTHLKGFFKRIGSAATTWTSD